MIIRNEQPKAREFIFCYNTMMKKYFLHGRSSSFIVDYNKGEAGTLSLLSHYPGDPAWTRIFQVFEVHNGTSHRLF